MDDEENELIPGLNDPRSVPLDVRIARYEAYLRDWTDFELAVRIAATNSILLEEAKFALSLSHSQLKSVAESNLGLVEVLGIAEIGCLIGAASSEKLVLASQELAAKRIKHSTAGTKGGKVRAAKQDPLKTWATDNAKNLHGNSAEKARKLFLKLPVTLAALSDDPTRVMADAIRAEKKLEKKRVAGLT